MASACASVGSDAVAGLLEAKLIDQRLEPLAVFGEVDRVRRSAEDRNALGSKALASFSGV